MGKNAVHKIECVTTIEHFPQGSGTSSGTAWLSGVKKLATVQPVKNIEPNTLWSPSSEPGTRASDLPLGVRGRNCN